jgi:hypothetical protein
MGASSWFYFTPFQPDPNAALQALRADVFARGAYSDPRTVLATWENPYRKIFELWKGREAQLRPEDVFLRLMLRLQGPIETGDYTGLSREDRRAAKRIREMVQIADSVRAEAPPPGAKPTSIEELLEVAAENGTHSILDIWRIGRRRDWATASPLSDAALRRVFHTTQPTRSEVETHWSDLAEPLGRWRAVYFTVYRDGKPDEYAFIGCSGD